MGEARIVPGIAFSKAAKPQLRTSSHMDVSIIARDNKRSGNEVVASGKVKNSTAEVLDAVRKLMTSTHRQEHRKGALESLAKV